MENTDKKKSVLAQLTTKDWILIGGLALLVIVVGNFLGIMAAQKAS